MATLESEWDARDLPTLQTYLEVKCLRSCLHLRRKRPLTPQSLFYLQIVRVSYFSLQVNGDCPCLCPRPLSRCSTRHCGCAGTAPVTNTMDSSLTVICFHVFEWSLDPSLAGALVCIAAFQNSSASSKSSVSAGRWLHGCPQVLHGFALFDAAAPHIDGNRPGSSDLLGVALSRPSYEIFRFKAPPKVQHLSAQPHLAIAHKTEQRNSPAHCPPPLSPRSVSYSSQLPQGPGTIIAEIFFQDHEQQAPSPHTRRCALTRVDRLVARTSGNTKTDK